MRFFRLNNSDYKGDLQSNTAVSLVAIDPGIASLGVCHIPDLTIRGFRHWSDERKDLRILTLSMPELMSLIKRRVEEYVYRMQQEGVVIGRTVFVMEYAHLRGEFSLGLYGVIQALTQKLMEKGAPRIAYIPNRIPEFLLKQRKKVGIGATRKLVTTLIPHIDGKTPVHECDAILFAMMAVPGYFSTHYGVNTRRSEIEVDIVNIQYGR